MCLRGAWMLSALAVVVKFGRLCWAVRCAGVMVSSGGGSWSVRGGGLLATVFGLWLACACGPWLFR